MTANVVPLYPEGVQFTRVERGSLTPLMRLVRLGARLLAYPAIALWSRFPYLPWPYEIVDAVAVVLRPVWRVRRSPVRLASCPAELMAPTRGNPAGALLYLHGGGFLIGGLNSHRRLVSRLVTRAEVTSLAVNYRKLPKQPFSAAVQDALDGYRYLIDRGYRPSEIAIAGDSAGGLLALTTALAARDCGLEAPGALVGISPMTRCDAGLTDDPGRASSDPLFPRSVFMTIGRLMRTTETSVAGLEVLDLFADASLPKLAGMPPTLIQVGSDEILRPDAEFAADRMARAGVPVELQVWNSAIHVFQLGADVMRDSAAAVDEIAAFLRTNIGREAA